MLARMMIGGHHLLQQKKMRAARRMRTAVATAMAMETAMAMATAAATMTTATGPGTQTAPLVAVFLRNNSNTIRAMAAGLSVEELAVATAGLPLQLQQGRQLPTTHSSTEWRRRRQLRPRRQPGRHRRLRDPRRPAPGPGDDAGKRWPPLELREGGATVSAVLPLLLRRRHRRRRHRYHLLRLLGTEAAGRPCLPVS